MSELVDISDTASDVIFDVTGSPKPSPTVTAVPWDEITLGRASTSRLDWLRRYHERLQGEIKRSQCKTVFDPDVGTSAYAATEPPPRPAAAQGWMRSWPEIGPECTHEAIIAVLRWWGRGAIADRLVYLQGLTRHDPDEPPMVLGSLRAMAHLLMSERQLPDPQIGVTPDGLVQVEWRVLTSGILAMEFLPSGLIRFAAVSGPARSGVDRRTVNGTLRKDEALAAIQPFIVHP